MTTLPTKTRYQYIYFRYPRCWCGACPMDEAVYCAIIRE